MLELAPRPVELLEEDALLLPELRLPALDPAPGTERDEQAERLRALAIAANPSTGPRHFAPAPVKKPTDLFTGYDEIYAALMLLSAGMMAGMIVITTVVTYALTIGRVP